MHIIFTFVYISTELMLFRNCRKDDEGETSKDRRAGMYDGFSETQTESQVLSYAAPFYFSSSILRDKVLFTFCTNFDK